MLKKGEADIAWGKLAVIVLGVLLLVIVIIWMKAKFGTGNESIFQMLFKTGEQATTP